TGGNWLTVSQSTGIAPGSFVAFANTAGLTAGSYSATITVTPSNGPALTLNATLLVSATALLLASPNNITFTAQPGSGIVTPASQAVAVTSTDGSVINYTVAVTYTGGSGWLFVNTSAGQTPSNLTLSANPFSLGTGTYSATVTLTATSPANIANSPLVLNVTLTVSPTATLGVSPALLSFVQATNGAQPAPQTVS